MEKIEKRSSLHKHLICLVMKKIIFRTNWEYVGWGMTVETLLGSVEKVKMSLDSFRKDHCIVVYGTFGNVFIEYV